MIPATPCVTALVTAPDVETARKIAKAALDQKLAACANIIPGVESHYWWEGKLEQSAEVLIIFKTTVKMQIALRECVLANHPYETPEFIAQTIDFGSDAYLTWIRQNVAML
jgi:periplasmic divalent cation tolerance protein